MTNLACLTSFLFCLRSKDDDSSGGVVVVLVVVVRGVTLLVSITHEGMHQFHLNFTEELGIIKYRSSSIRGGGGLIRKILTELWPFLAKLSICVSDQ